MLQTEQVLINRGNAQTPFILKTYKEQLKFNKKFSFSTRFFHLFHDILFQSTELKTIRKFGLLHNTNSTISFGANIIIYFARLFLNYSEVNITCLHLINRCATILKTNINK